MFVVIYYGDLDRDGVEYLADHRCFGSLDSALTAIATDFPILTNADESWRESPDPEDDRIVVWECVPGSKLKAVWHFSGWHFDSEEFNLPQGTLPGDDASLYDLAME